VTAKQKLNRLKINGHTVEITTSDSVNYQLLETINCRAIDTTHAKDSIQRFFGYKNVVIYKKL
jgi:hypothetical protein